MKTRTAIVATLLLLSTFIIPLSTLHAQEPPRPENLRAAPGPDITKLVSDLTPAQRQKLEGITKESRHRLETLHQRHHAVRDSIRLIMDREGDQSALLNPLFEREAKLQAEISREMYATKVRMDQILTREQRRALLKSMKKRGPAEQHADRRECKPRK